MAFLRMKLGLGVKIGTSLSLTPQLQQAIRLLQLSSLELQQEVQMQLETNPLLEQDSPEFENELSLSDIEPDTTQDDFADIEVTELGEQLEQTKLGEDLVVDTQWEEVYTHAPTKWDKAAASDFDYQGETTDSIQSHLLWQMNLKTLSPVDQLISQRLIDSLDEKGYITIDLNDMCDNLNAELAFSGIDYDVELIEIHTVLKQLQQCEPLGVAARDLAECLQLQLTGLPQDTAHLQSAEALLEHHELLIKNDLKKLLSKTGLDVDSLQEAMGLIRTLDPHPGMQFNPPDNSYQAPDVLVQVQSFTDEHGQEKSGWQVRLNPDTLPKLRVNNDYAKLIKRGDDSADNVYLKTHLQDAKHFIKGVDERNKSLLKVATAIVQEQHAFFEQGVTSMKPLILRDIAEQVDLHESTVSRITTNKYMLTPLGMFELKYFFSSQVGAVGDEHSSTAICAMIKDLIAQENPKKPLSDSKLVKMLQEQGVDVARRTIAKYRESMGIGSSTDRKRLL